MKKILPLIFFGSSNFSVYVLKEFLKKYKPLLVITLKGKPKGRGLKIEPNPVYSYCLKEKLNVIEFENWQKILEDLKKLKPLVGVVASFGKIIPKEIINLFPKGILNIHPSLLPKYRGPNPIRETILQGDKETGITIFLIDELIDHGPIIIQETLPLTGKENFIQLEEKLGKLGGKVLSKIIEDYFNDKLTPTPQDETKATYTKKLTKEDGILNLNDSYQNWDRKIRALNPWPGTFIYLQGKIFKIFEIEKINEKNLPKEILKTKIGEFFVLKNDLGIRLNDAFVILKEVQIEGRKKMSGREFLNGFRSLIFGEKS
jgi:methionyl-tRNA formyltransferase